MAGVFAHTRRLVAALSASLAVIAGGGYAGTQRLLPIPVAAAPAAEVDATTILPIGLIHAGTFSAPLPQTPLRPGAQFGVTLWEVPTSKLPSTADSNSPAFWD